VQQQGAATAPTSSDLSRPAKASHLHQRPSVTVVRLVHTEEITGLFPVVIDGPWLPVHVQALTVAAGIPNRRFQVPMLRVQAGAALDRRA
jgi:hypothetical protein